MTTDGQDNAGEKLYAGKFKTVEELETGYKNSLPTFQENENLKKQLQESTKVPDLYNVPADIALHESDIEIVKLEAKNSALTQNQFEKLIRERNARSAAKHQKYEQSKHELGADNINLLQDFLTKTYPAKVAEKLLDDAISNKEIRETLMAERTKSLNSTVPGSSRVSTGGAYAVTQKDVLKARDEMNGARGRSKIDARNRYLALQKQMAHQKQA